MVGELHGGGVAWWWSCMVVELHGGGVVWWWSCVVVVMYSGSVIVALSKEWTSQTHHRGHWSLIPVAGFPSDLYS